MVKVRSDIILVTFVLFFVVALGNYFFPAERREYKKAEPSGYDIGMPADSSVTVVSTLQELEEAADSQRIFAIKVDKSKLTKTDYYYSNTYRKNGAFKANPFVMGIRYAYDNETYDRIYVAELEDGNRIPVRIFERALDLSDDTIVLPIGEITKLKSSEMLEAVDEKYDLTATDAVKWYVDASGYYFRQDYLLDKAATGTRNWGIVCIGVVLYVIVSTIGFMRARKKQ